VGQADRQSAATLRLEPGRIPLDNRLIVQLASANAQQYPVATNCSVMLQYREFQTRLARPLDQCDKYLPAIPEELDDC
jgi:hypothetical protein